jgi:hypothetical protein
MQPERSSRALPSQGRSGMVPAYRWYGTGLQYATTTNLTVPLARRVSILGVMEPALGRRVRLPQDAITERRASTRFPLTLEVHYAVSGPCGVPVETGSGRTIDLSSSGLRFTADRPLLTGQTLDVSIDWPVLLNGVVQLQLVMLGVIVRTRGTTTAVKTQRYAFKTRGDSLTIRVAGLRNDL